MTATAPQDGSSKGCLQVGVCHTRHRDLGRVGDFLKCFDPLQSVVGQVPSLHETPQLGLDEFVRMFGVSSRPYFPSWYRDNIDLVFANIPPGILPFVQFACATVLRTVYSLPFKWVPHGTAVEWGQCAVLLRALATTPHLRACCMISSINSTHATSCSCAHSHIQNLFPNTTKSLQ